jgi:hypothetical protein
MSRRAARAAFPLALALVLLAFPAPPAVATFHLVQVREVYPGSGANPDSEYVELQMWSGGQNLLGGHVVRSYDASAAVTGASAFPADVANDANQSTMILATPQAEAEFGFVADGPLAPAGQLSHVGGAVCWETIDCIAWGSFAGSLPSPAGAAAAPGGIPDGMALRRSIARDCATALDPADDSDQSQADFEVVFPAPRPNAVAPSEKTCSGAGVGGGAGGPAPAGEAPQTFLRRKPARKTRDRTPTFRFGSDERGASFECSLDRKRFRACSSPLTTRRLGSGPHRFRVRAVRDDVSDPSPASYRFTVLRLTAR